MCRTVKKGLLLAFTWTLWASSASIMASRPVRHVFVFEEHPGCFRRLVTGRSLNQRFIKKTLLCDSLRSCEEACAQERDFNCQGFNFRFDPTGYEQSRCQLTSMPSKMLDVTSDFNSDRDVDFFERDSKAPRTCFYPYTEYRPWTGYGEPGPGRHPPGGWNPPPTLPEYLPPPPPDYHGHNELGPPGGGYPDHHYPDHHHVPPNHLGPPDRWDPRPTSGDKGGYEMGGGPGAHTALQLGSGSWGLPDECFVRTRAGFRLDRPVVVLALRVPSLYHCELECVNEKKFLCNSFDFRYSESVPGDNCHLAERSLTTLDTYTDILPDRDFDIYQRNPNGRHGCQPKQYWGSDCFERIRSGLRLKGDMTKFSTNAPSLSACESACIHMPYFTCRAFSYRYGGPVIGHDGDNCLMTDWPVPEMDPTKHFIDDPGCELYHRGSYGHGCEISRHPDKMYLPPSPAPGGTSGSGGTPLTGPGSLLGHHVYGTYGNELGPTYLPPKDQSTYWKPSGHSQWHHGHTGPSYYLPPSSYGGEDHRTRPADQMCYIRYSSPARLVPSAIRSSLYVPSEAECKAECSRAREKTMFRCATFSYSGNQCELSDIEQRDLRPEYDYLEDKDFWMFTWDFGTARCYYPPPFAKPTPGPGPGHGHGHQHQHTHQHFFPEGDRGVEGTWSRYTVNGQPCKMGTACALNPELGVWTCPVDNGGWDYCCRSGHQCGYSDGFPYPWCYVGSTDRDQWRPCSDTYYPYTHSGRKLHWPVAYLHREGPPNATVTQNPSLVDSFLESLRKEAERKLGSTTTLSTPTPTNSTNLELVEVAEPRSTSQTGTDSEGGESAMAKLWTWGQSRYNMSLLPSARLLRHSNRTESSTSTTSPAMSTTPSPSSTTSS